MKLHLPLNLLAALITSFSGVTLGTATFAGVSGLLITVSQAYAADVAFNGTQVNVAAGGSSTYDVGTVTASTTLNFAGAGNATITNLNGDAPEAVLTVNRVANGGTALSTLTLNGAGTFNGIISLYSNTTGGTQNNILNLNHALAAQNATIKLGGYGYATGASVLKAGVNTSISKLVHNNTAALITGEGTTLTITGDSSSYGGSFGGTFRSASAPSSSTRKVPLRINLVRRTMPPTAGAEMASCMALRSLSVMFRPASIRNVTAPVITPSPPIWINNDMTV